MPSQSFGFEKLLEVAEELARRSEEQYLRTAVGRAYYYIFHLARQRLKENRFPLIKGADSHRQVWEKFSGSPDSRCRLLGETGSVLKEKRVMADYEQSYPRIEEDASIVVDMAKRFAKQLSQLKADLPRNMGVKV